MTVTKAGATPANPKVPARRLAPLLADLTGTLPVQVCLQFAEDQGALFAALRAEYPDALVRPHVVPDYVKVCLDLEDVAVEITLARAEVGTATKGEITTYLVEGEVTS